MADIRQPKQVTYNYGIFKTLTGTSGTSGVADTFFGPRDKAYVDFQARDMTRLRGTNAYYYVLDDQTRRIDGDKPLDNSENGGRVDVPEGTEPDPFQRTAHAGLALYGERVKIGIDAPRSITVLREELLEEVAGENREATTNDRLHRFTKQRSEETDRHAA